jgi:hypothetical protein
MLKNSIKIPINIISLDINKRIIKSFTEINNISQEEIAEGWKLKLPYKRVNQDNINIIINLSELPPHLWNIYIDKILYNNNDDIYIKIYDKILLYNIIKSEHNDLLLNLYNEINKLYPHKKKLIEYYNYCKINNINGWIIIKLEKLLFSNNL